MSKQVQHRRGSNADHATFTGAIGEITVDTTNNRLVLHDGVTPGGIQIARLDEIGGGDFIPMDYLDADVTLAADSDEKIATQHATRVYVDNEVATLQALLDSMVLDLDDKVAVTGDTMTGHLFLPTGPAAANAVRKDYVDSADASLNALIGTKANTSALPVAATAAEFQSNSAPTKMLTSGAVWTAAASVLVTPVGTILTPDMGAGFDFIMSLPGASNTIANPANSKSGQKGVFYIQQGSGGGKTVTWGDQYYFPGGTKPVLTTAAFAMDAVSYVCNGGVYLCTFAADFR